MLRMFSTAILRVLLLLIGPGLLWASDAAAERLPASVAMAYALDERVIGGLITYPSEVYAEFHRFARATPRAQLVRLLHHENRVVRAYTAQYLAQYLPAHAAAFYPLLADTERISVNFPDCESEKKKYFILADYVIQSLCRAGDAPAVNRLLKKASTDPTLRDNIRTEARKCVDYYSRAMTD